MNTPVFLPNALYPCLTGEMIAKQGSCPLFLSQLRGLVSAPSDIYTELYLGATYRFMELCQALPMKLPWKEQTEGAALSQRLGAWHPVTGCLYEPKTFYQLESEAGFHALDHSALLTAWVGRLIPVVALRWLSETPDVFPVWLTALTQRPSQQNPLLEHLAKTAEALGWNRADSRSRRFPKFNLCATRKNTSYRQS